MIILAERHPLTESLVVHLSELGHLLDMNFERLQDKRGILSVSWSVLLNVNTYRLVRYSRLYFKLIIRFNIRGTKLSGLLLVENLAGRSGYSFRFQL
jgi:hypothetical protein